LIFNSIDRQRRMNFVTSLVGSVALPFHTIMVATSHFTQQHRSP